MTRATPRFRKVIVIGLDGLDPGVAGPLLDAGELPHMAALRACGGFTRVATTSPAQTPVAWSTFATGVNPGGHGIFDFLRRDPATYLPDLSLNRYEQKNAFTPPRAVNLRGGTPLWSILADANVPATVLRCPCTFPPDPVRGRLLSGMGVPDLRGGLGTATYYTTVPGVRPGESEQVVPLNRGDGGAITTHLIGPRNPKDRSDLRTEFSIHPDPAADSVRIRCAAARPAEIELRKGAWSEWLQVPFKVGLLNSVKGMVRFYLRSVAPELELYASPVNFDPAAPLFPISHPAPYARELAEDLGPFYTTGMVEDHAGLTNGRLDERAFLAQCDEVWDEREAMMLRELERNDEGLFYCLFDTPDRVQHLFWRYLEPDHPAHFGRPVPDEFARVVADQYRRADAAVGAALAHADDDTLFIALSDHGFGSFRRCVDLNAWLHAQGLLTLTDGRSPGPEAGDLLRAVDWSRTQAYAIGLGGIYLNLQDREGQGIVPPDEAEGLKASIASALSGLPDTHHQTTAVRGVLPREQLYSGPFTHQAPDLLVHFERGYRASWESSMGGVGASVLSDNTRAWAGDHIVDPALVPGLLLMNRPFDDSAARLLDLAPTILSALGLPPGPAMEGRNLLP